MRGDTSIISAPHREDADRRRFLERLDAAPFDVTEWEAAFIESVMRRDQRLFTPKQREKIDQMRSEYEGRL